MDHHQLHLFDNLRKRRKLDHGEGTNQLSHGDYTVGWVCALPLEAAAAMAMLDNIHPALHTHSRDSNSYTLGSIGNHNVVIACLPAGLYGTTSAATVAGNMFISFGSIRHLLMVGIGGGVPSVSADIRLGDVVVSIPTPRFEGVVQYDYGKTIGEGRFERTGTLNKPSTSLLTAVSNLRAEDLRRGSQIPVLMSEMLAQNPQMTKTYTSPGPHKDLLFVPDYEHDQSKPTCELCDRERLVTRLTRGNDQPVVHYGLIASGNQVIKHAQTRDRLATDLNILCFEMEAAGLMDNFPCLVIRGVSDYSDSHKKKEWQGYAAATAAAYAKQLLATIGVSSPRHVSNAEVPRQISMADHRANMMDALRFDQLESRQATIKAAHAKTCTWLPEKKEYMEWLDSNHFHEHRGFLWIKGKAGSGKSTMMKFAFQQAFASRHEETVVISFFFNARGGDLEKTTLGMYRSLLFQLFEKVPELQALLDEVSSLNREENHPWSHTILQHLFRRSIAILSGRRITCFIDALDECEEEQVRAMIDYIQSLGDHAVSSGVQLNVCFSSRHYPHIAVEKGLELVLEDQEGHADDITRYLHSELKIGRSKQAGQIQDEIIEKASGIFLWVVLVVQILRREFERGRLHELRKRLREIPARLSDLFKDILTRDTANMDDLLLSIQWILFAKRPLKLEEFYYAILSVDPDNLTDAWEPGSISPDDMSRFLLDSSKGLAEVTKSKDKTVQFIHESVRDFLLKENGLWELWPQHQHKFEALSHDRLKECCNNFLQTDVRKHIPMEENLPSASSEDARVLRRTLTEQFPFLEYAVRNLLHHADASDRGGIHQEAFIQRLDFATWIRCSNAIERYQIRRYTPSASLLYILAEYNLSNLIRTVRKKEPCINLPGERYHYPLFAALANGNDSAVRALLEPDEAFRNIRGAYELAQVVHRNEIQSLIGRGKRVKPKRSSSLISFAIEEDEGSMADLIMTACHHCQLDDSAFLGVFCDACKDGKGHVLDFLAVIYPAQFQSHLQHPNGSTEPPLFCAIRGGQAGIFRRLLDSGWVDINYRHRGNTKPHRLELSLSAYQSLLSGTKPQVENMDEDGVDQTALHCTVKHGQEAIFNHLLATKHVAVNARDSNGQTPLHYAVRYAQEAMFNQILGAGFVDVNARDKSGQTPLHYSVRYGKHTMLSHLLATDQVDVNARDNDGQTALYYTIRCEKKDIFSQILCTDGIDLNAEENNGFQPIHPTIQRSMKTMFNQLLMADRVDLNTRNRSGKTPFEMALSNCQDNFIKLVTDRTNADFRNDIGMTPLTYAAREGLTIVVRRLLSTGKVDPNFENYLGWTPLAYAAHMGHADIVNLLLSAAGIDPDSKDNLRWTPLLKATVMGHGDIVSQLLATGRVNVLSQDLEGETALSRAKAAGNDKIVRILEEWLTLTTDSYEVT